MKKLFLIIIAILVVAHDCAAQTRLYVNPSSTGQNTGASWADAFTDLHYALSVALSGDEIWVAQGEYRPDTASNRDRSFVLKSGIKLYGSFNGTENSLAQRNIVAHPTILSGNIGNAVDSTDNSYTILYMAYPDTSTLLDGLTLQHGYAISDTNFFNLSPVLSGGAVYVLAKNGKGMPVFANCTFRDNVARSRGGAIFVHGQNSSGSTPLFRHCVFYNNKSLGSGGAVYISGGNNMDRGIEFDHCHFESNSAGTFGGAISMENAFGTETLNFLSCMITKGYASISGGFLYMLKSGGNPSKITIDSCEISKNKAKNTCGLYVESSGIEFPTIFKLRDSKIFDNEDGPQPSYGGVIYLGEYSPFSPATVDTFIIAGNDIYSNKTYLGVLSLSSFNAWARVENNLLSYNGPPQANSNSGGGIRVSGKNIEISNNICLSNSLTPLSGFVVASLGSKLQIHDNLLYNNIMIGNISTYYSTLILGAGVNTFFGYTDSAQVFNNNFYKNTTRVTGNLNSDPFPRNVYANNIFLGNRDFLTGNLTIPLSLNWDSIYFSHNLMDIDCATLSPRVDCGPNNLFNLDPLFRDTANHDYSLLPCSPLLNKGSNLAAAGILTDLNGNPRIQEGTVDIGAYESPAFALAAPPAVLPACASDSNGSISVSPVFGCEPYDYQWLPPAGNGPELNGLPPGQYLLSITDASGRQILDTITVGQATAPTLSLASSDVQCGGQAGGSLLASVVSGTAPFQYQWSPAAPDTAQLSKLPPGSYALTLIDANGCRDSAMASIALLGMLQPMIGGGTISCNGAADGWLSLTPATGAAPFSWLWDGWPGTDSIAQPLGPGNYSVTVTDAYGCTASNTFPAMTDPAPITATVGTTDQTDLVMPNGAAVVTTTSGGTPSQPPAQPYAYSWSNGGMGQFIAGLLAGEYTVTVTDQNGCTASVTVEVDLMVGTEEAEGQALMIYPNPTADWVQVVLPARQGLAGVPENMGTARLELSDASGRMLRSAEASAGVFDLRGLPSGSYVLTVRDVVGEVVFVGKVVKR